MNCSLVDGATDRVVEVTAIETSVVEIVRVAVPLTPLELAEIVTLP
jgi:hypothetical protein